jgi:hypothetical protein
MDDVWALTDLVVGFKGDDIADLGKKVSGFFKKSPTSGVKRVGEIKDVVGRYGGRGGAFNQAKRDAGIPVSQQPYKTEKVNLIDSKTKEPVMNHKTNQPVQVNEYHYINKDGKEIVIQDHAKGHDFGQGGIGNQDSHFNVRPINNTQTGKVPNTKPHYEFKNRGKK